MQRSRGETKGLRKVAYVEGDSVGDVDVCLVVTKALEPMFGLWGVRVAFGRLRTPPRAHGGGQE